MTEARLELPDEEMPQSAPNGPWRRPRVHLYSAPLKPHRCNYETLIDRTVLSVKCPS